MISIRVLYNLTQFNCFGTKRVVQKRRHLLKILHPEEKIAIDTDSSQCLPKSLLKNSVIRKLVYSNTLEATKLASVVDWDAYKSDVKGVRWHPSGSWLVQFNRKNYQKNFFVNCHCYFSVEKYGFHEAKRQAILYRRRLEDEYKELEETWIINARSKSLNKSTNNLNELIDSNIFN